MSGVVTFESMYNLGYQDAIEDVRDIIDNILQDIPISDETRSSYYAGMKAALYKIAERTYNIKG